MYRDVDVLDPHSGRIIREDNSIINFANSIDPTGGIYVLSEMTHGIHKGDAYSFSADGSILGASSLYFMGVTGNKQIHFDLFSGDFQKGGIRISFYESPTTTLDGTAQTPINMNFASANISTMLLYSTPTITTNGTIKATKFLPITGSGSNIPPAAGELAGGRVLKANTKYLFRIENTDAVACSFGVNFVWHDSDVVV